MFVKGRAGVHGEQGIFEGRSQTYIGWCHAGAVNLMLILSWGGGKYSLSDRLDEELNLRLSEREDGRERQWLAQGLMYAVVALLMRTEAAWLNFVAVLKLTKTDVVGLT